MDFTDAITENTLRAIRFERPKYIPVVFWINPACWHHYPQDALHELVSNHPLLFPHPQSPPPPLAPWERAGRPYVDAWGCTWETMDDGITGSVIRHPLADWDALERFTPPGPNQTNGMAPIDWCDIKKKIASICHCEECSDEAISTLSVGDCFASLAMTCGGCSYHKGELPVGSLEHGHTFLRLSYLRGYERLLYDMADGDHRLRRLIEMVETFSLGIVQRYIDLGVAMMRYPEDLGMQRGPMLSPEHFRKYIKPVYERLMAPARAAGCLVHMHSDGDIRDLVDDLVVSGVDALNLQDLVNGIDWIAARLKGRICIDLDIDRQSITRFGSPGQIDDLIREEVQKLGSPEGGLMMIYGLYPGVPLENVKTLMDALERYATFYA
jgi:uroporphyrinogen decarboxylase